MRIDKNNPEFMKKYLTTVGAYIFSLILLTVFIGLILDVRHASKIQTEQKPEKASSILAE